MDHFMVMPGQQAKKDEIKCSLKGEPLVPSQTYG
jgi:hypothetical protein